MTGQQFDLKKITKENEDFRRVLFTGPNAQLVVMSLAPGEEIGDEVHHVDQTLYAVKGNGQAVLEGDVMSFEKGDAVCVPAGTRHNVRNPGDKALKLFTLYSPPQHAPNTIHRTKQDVHVMEPEPAAST